MKKSNNKPYDPNNKMKVFMAYQPQLQQTDILRVEYFETVNTGSHYFCITVPAIYATSAHA